MLWDLFMLFLRILEVLGTLLVGAAAFFGAWVAWKGWKGWKREIRGQTEYKLAVDLLATTYRFRDAINFARHPMISAHEMFEEGDNFNPLDPTQNFKGNARAYEKRWEQVMKEQHKIYNDLQSAEVIWGEEVKNLFQDLFAHGNELLWAMENYLKIINPAPSTEREKLKERLLEKITAILRKSADEDKFGDELQRLITKIDNYIKPKLNP